MGNQPSSNNGSGQEQAQRGAGATSAALASPPNLRNLFAKPNALGLTKAELDERCRPSGLYQSCLWDDKTIRRWIGDGKLAPRYVGREQRATKGDYECPICFLHYPVVNWTRCCQAHVCTECVLQVKHPKDKSTCPFCNSSKLSIQIAPVLDALSIAAREQEEQRVLEAQIRARDHSNLTVTPWSPDHAAEDESDANSTAPYPLNANDSFGSSLEQQLMRRQRSSSAAAAGLESDLDDVSSFAMTTDERRRLEEQVRSQRLHPLSQRLQQEEAERRLRNEQAYYERTTAGRLAQLRARRDLLQQHQQHGHAAPPRRDWNRIVEAFEASGAGGRGRGSGDRTGSLVNSIDDLVVLEAAIMLSMEEEARRAASAPATAADASTRPSASRDPPGGSTMPSRYDNDAAARHALAGFPMARSRAAAAAAAAEQEHSDMYHDPLAAIERLMSRNFGGAAAGQSLPSRRSRSSAYHIRGYTEEEQIAMAIAASLRESQPTCENASVHSDDGAAEDDAARAAAPATRMDAPPTTATTSLDEEEEMIDFLQDAAAPLPAAFTEALQQHSVDASTAAMPAGESMPGELPTGSNSSSGGGKK